MRRTVLKVIAAIVTLISFVASVNAQISWQKYEGNPVLRPGNFGSFDQSGAFSSSVLLEDGVFRMWYVGNGGNFTIGEALSPDGIRWYGLRTNPVITPGLVGSFDETGVRVSSVLRDKEGYKLYYYTGSGFNLKVGLATSADGTTWTKYPRNPILDVGSSGAWDAVGVWAAMVVFENRIYKMWYQGFDGTFASIGYATSPDGVNWTKHGNNPVIPHGSNPTDFDYRTAGEPRVVIARGRYHLLYTSTSSGLENQVGYAHSMDGVKWTKYDRNPVLTTGPSGWDNTHVASGGVVYKSGMLHMWYSGYGFGGWQIGYATSGFERKGELFSEEVVNEAVTLPAKFQILENFPNPFNPSTRLRIAIPEPGRVRISVFQVTGRLVKVLADENVDQGWYDINWDGKTASGVDAASGIYFARVEFIAEGKSAVSAIQKMSLTK